jgi:hypothetical protein
MSKKNRRTPCRNATVIVIIKNRTQQVLHDEPQELGFIPESTNPCASWKSMFVFISMSLALSSRKILRPFNSRVVSPLRAALAMSIAREGLQPPGTTKIRTPSPAVPCFSTTSLNFVTALSVKLTITSFLLAEIFAIFVSV